ncbi:unnamed protein product, partial [Protopolystoma xenopodis]
PYAPRLSSTSILIITCTALHRLSGADSAYSGPGLPVISSAASSSGDPSNQLVSFSASSHPRLFVKPKAKSNRMVIVNAIGHCCLAGAVNEPVKLSTLKELASAPGTHFIILFRDSRCQYRSVYTFDLETEELHILCGSGPRKVTHDMVDKFFKYNCGSKSFSQITSTKHLSPVVDAITIHGHFWGKSATLLLSNPGHRR